MTKKYRVVEVVDTRRYYRNFLLIINKYDLILVKIYEYILKIIIDYEELLFSVIEKFRYFIRLYNNYKSYLLI